MDELTIESFHDFEKDKTVIDFKKMIETGDIEVNLHYWSIKLVDLIKEHPKDEWIICLFGWFTFTYFLPFDKHIPRLRTIVNMDMDNLNTKKEIRECFETQKIYIKHIIDKGIQSLEEIKRNNRRNKSMFDGKRHIDTELCIITEIEEDIEINSKKSVTPYFDSDLTDETLTKIMHLLIKTTKGLNEIDAGLWLYWFNRNPKFENIRPIKWNGSPSMLTNIIQQICKTAEADTILAAFGEQKVTATADKHSKTVIGKAIKQLITIDKQKK